MSMEWSIWIPYGLHSGYEMKKMAGFPAKKWPILSPWNGVGIYLLHMENSGEWKDLYNLLLLPNYHDLPGLLIILYSTLKYSHGIN